MTVPHTPWISVVVPIKDERDNLHPLTNQLTKVLGAMEQSHTAPFEIVYVDDGSTDGSSTLLDEICLQNPEVRVVHFDGNHGQTAAFDAGFRHAQGELIATLDGDLQDLVEPHAHRLASGACVACCLRGTAIGEHCVC